MKLATAIDSGRKAAERINEYLARMPAAALPAGAT